MKQKTGAGDSGDRIIPPEAANSKRNTGAVCVPFGGLMWNVNHFTSQPGALYAYKHFSTSLQELAKRLDVIQQPAAELVYSLRKASDSEGGQTLTLLLLYAL